MINAQEAYQAQLPSKTKVIKEIGIKDFLEEIFCQKDLRKTKNGVSLTVILRTQHKKNNSKQSQDKDIEHPPSHISREV